MFGVTERAFCLVAVAAGLSFFPHFLYLPHVPTLTSVIYVLDLVVCSLLLQH